MTKPISDLPEDTIRVENAQSLSIKVSVDEARQLSAATEDIFAKQAKAKLMSALREYNHPRKIIINGLAPESQNNNAPTEAQIKAANNIWEKLAVEMGAEFKIAEPAPLSAEPDLFPANQIRTSADISGFDNLPLLVQPAKENGTAATKLPKSPANKPAQPQQQNSKPPQTQITKPDPDDGFKPLWGSSFIKHKSRSLIQPPGTIPQPDLNRALEAPLKNMMINDAHDRNH